MIAIPHRHDFPKLLDHYNMRTAIEVGSAYGHFARTLLQSKSLETLWLVDNEWYDDARWDAVQKLAKEDARVKLCRESSEAAASSLPGADFIYLDAMHEYEHIAVDIRLWLPKARKCIAGHDYAFYNSVVGCPNGVVLAVEEAFGDSALVTGCLPTRVDRMRAAYEATTKKDYGYMAEDIPSWYVLLKDGD